MNDAPFRIDPDPRVARTPPGRFYRDPTLHEAGVEAAFPGSWQPLLDVPDRLRPGEQVPVDLLPGSLAEPLLVVADEDGERVLSNVCTHRGATLLDAPRRGRRIVCPYHGRCFGLDGRVVSAPGFAGREAELPGLAEVETERLGPLRFVRLQAGQEGLGGLEAARRALQARVPDLPWDTLGGCPQAAADYEVPAHWALYVENYLEGLHIRFVHPGLDQAVARDGYTVEVVPGGVLQTARGRGDEEAFPGGLAALYLWLFPNVMLNVYPWGLSLNVVAPRSPRACRVSFRSWIWDERRVERGAGAGLHQVEEEDEAIVARVQRGIGALAYGRGHYAVPAELGVHAFHRMLTGVLWG